jgi:hypothetical protein
MRPLQRYKQENIFNRYNGFRSDAVATLCLASQQEGLGGKLS